MSARHAVAPHLVPLHAVRIAGEDHRDRGRARGGALAAQVAQTARAYADLFGELGIDEVAQREAARASLEALRGWDPEQHEEILGVAEGAQLGVLDVARTVARTEILTLAATAPGECSTVVHQAPGASVSAQTWDWYDRFRGCWHPHRVEPLPGEQAHAGFVEYGMPGKIGLNAAGVGVHLNILKHREDAPGGVPVHSVLARVLARATSVEDAVDIVRSAPTSSSSVLTLTSVDRVAMVEVAPGSISVLDGPGWRVHTNHFLAHDRQEGALLLDPTSTTHDRMAFLDERCAGRPAPRCAEDLVPLLCSPLEEGTVALLPDETLPASERVATLVTVRTDPARRRISLSPGVPQHAAQASLTYQL